MVASFRPKDSPADFVTNRVVRGCSGVESTGLVSIAGATVAGVTIASVTVASVGIASARLVMLAGGVITSDTTNPSPRPGMPAEFVTGSTNGGTPSSGSSWITAMDARLGSVGAVNRSTDARRVGGWRSARISVGVGRIPGRGGSPNIVGVVYTGRLVVGRVDRGLY